MKIGILTFVNTTNFGASLQAYALQQTILNKGHECEIINYACEKIEEAHDPKKASKKRGLKLLLAPILKYTYRKIYNEFRKFEGEYCHFSVPCNALTVSTVAKKYDRIVVGSDQVWNTAITGNDKSFFLDFIEDDKKKYSYAASVGTEYFTERIPDYEALVREFQMISVREKGTAARLRESIGREDVVSDVDPTLLNCKNWDSFVIESNKYGNYILLYFLPNDPNLFDAIRSFAKGKGCQLIDLSKSLKRIKGIRKIHCASPIDFINLIAHAQYVISGSFHALCFSLILHKRFYVTSAPKEDRNGRLIDLLSTLGLTERLVGKPDYGFVREEPNYDDIEKKLEEIIDVSMDTIERICEESGE